MNFVAKQMIGNKLGAVKGAIGGGDEDKEKTDDGEQANEAEIAEARREQEEERKEKHRKMEEEREDMRQGIRDKYNIKKKVVEVPLVMEQDDSGRVGRVKKTPEEMRAEAEGQGEEENPITEAFNKVMGYVNNFMGKGS